MPYPTSLPTWYTAFSTPITLQAMQHTTRHKNMESDIVEIAKKLGVSSSLPTTGKFLKSHVDGGSAWSDITMSDVGGVAPIAKGGTNAITDTAARTNLGIYSKTEVDAIVLLAVAAANQAAYPVGAIYENASDATSPATKLGFGTWTAIDTSQDRQLLSTKILHWSTGDVTGTTARQNVLGTYDYNMLTSMLTSKNVTGPGTITIPQGYHVEYKMQAELSTGGDTTVKLFLNNIETNPIQTWSGSTFRVTGATNFFKSTDIILEATVGYGTSPGINFGWVANNANSVIRVYLPTLSAYLVRDTPIYKWVRTA